MIAKYSADTDFSIRIGGIKEMIIENFKQSFPEIKIDTKALRNDPDNHVLTFQLNSRLNYKKLCTFVENIKNSEYERFDIFMSVTSEIDNCIVDMPDFVLKAIRELPLTDVCISFIFIDLEWGDSQRKRAKKKEGKREKWGRIYFKQVDRMFLDFKVKEISHAKEGASTGTELPENLESGEAKDAKWAACPDFVEKKHPIFHKPVGEC